jgi:hypothetical protein
MYSGNPRGDKVKFSYWNYDKGLFLDEKKKRFVDFGDMDFDTFKNYSDNFRWVINYNLNFSIALTTSAIEQCNTILEPSLRQLIFLTECTRQESKRWAAALSYSKTETNISAI